MADITKLASGVNLLVGKDNGTLQAVNPDTRANVPTAGWSATEVPNGAISHTIDGSFIYYLFSDRIEKWVLATKVKVSDPDIDLDPDDGTPVDVSTGGDWLFVTFNDSLKIKSFKKTLDSRVVTRSGGRQIGLPGLGTRAPLTISRFLDGYFVTASTGTLLNYYYVTKAGQVTRSRVTSRWSQTTTPRSRTERTQTGTRSERYVTGSRTVRTLTGYTRGSQVFSGSTSGSYSTASAARSAASSLGSSYSGSSYERVTGSTSFQQTTPGSTNPASKIGDRTAGSWTTSRSTALSAAQSAASSASSSTQEGRSASTESRVRQVSSGTVHVTTRQTSSNYSTASAARTAGNSLSSSLASTYPSTTHTRSVSTTTVQVPATPTYSTRTLGTFYGPWRTTSSAATADDASVKATAASSTSGTDRRYSGSNENRQASVPGSTTSSNYYGLWRRSASSVNANNDFGRLRTTAGCSRANVSCSSRTDTRTSLVRSQVTSRTSSATYTSRSAALSAASRLASSLRSSYPSPTYTITTSAIDTGRLRGNDPLYAGVASVSRQVRATTGWRAHIVATTSSGSTTRTEYRRVVVVTQRYQTNVGATVTRYKGVVSVSRRTTSSVTEYRGTWELWRKASTTPGGSVTRYRGTLTVYSRVAQYTSRRETTYGTRQVPVYSTNVVRWNEYTRTIKKLFANNTNLIASQYTGESSSLSTEGRFRARLQLQKGAAPARANALDATAFDNLTHTTGLSDQTITSVRLGLLGQNFMNRLMGSNYLANIAIDASNKAIAFVPYIVGTSTSQTSAEMRAYDLDLSANTATEIVAFRGKYPLYPTPSTNLNDLKDICWNGTDADTWKNLCFKRGSNAHRITSLSPFTTSTTALAAVPTSVSVVAGSGFHYESATDWAAGIEGGIWVTGQTTSQISQRQTKDAYTHATTKYRYIDHRGDNIIAMATDGTITLFGQNNGILSLTRSIDKSWVPSSVLTASLSGITMTATHAYIGHNNPDYLIALSLTSNAIESSKNIPQSVIDPASVPRYNFNVLDKAIEVTGEDQEVRLELANGGVGRFSYELVSTQSSHISLDYTDGVLQLEVDRRIEEGNYNLLIRAEPEAGQNLGGPLSDEMTLRVRPRSLFQITQENLRYDTLLGEVTIELNPWTLKNLGLADVPNRYLAARVTWTESTGDDATANDWEFKGNDQSLSDWNTNREFVMKATLPVGTHTFRYEVLENNTSESYTNVSDFEPINRADARVHFDLVVTASTQGSPLTPIFAPADIYHQKSSGDVSLILSRAFGGTNVFVYSVANLPTGVTFDAATRRLSIDDSAVVVGEYNIRYTYQQRNAGNTNNIGLPVSESFTLVITTLSQVTINQSDVIFAPSLGSRRIFLSSPEGGTGRYRISLDGLPTGVTFADAPPSIFLPETVPVGTYSIQYRVQPIDNLGQPRGDVVSDAFDIQVIAFDEARASRYSYAAVYKWIDGNGLEHFSGVQLKNIRLVGKIGEFYQGAQIGVNINVDKIRTTDKVPVYVEIYRTQANLSSRHRIAQVDFADEDNTVQFVDTIRDEDIGDHELVYTDVNQDSNIQPEGATTMQVFSNNLAIAGMAGDKRRVLISRLFRFEFLRPVEFDGLIGYILPEDILSLKRIDNLCIIFTVSRIFFLNIAKLQGAVPAEIQTSAGIIPDSKNSIVRINDGLLFKSSKGIYLLNRSLTLQYVGKDVERFNNDRCLKTVLSNKRKEVYFLLDSAPNRKVLIFNLDFSRWSVIDADDVTDISVFKGDLLYLKEGRLFSHETDSFTLGDSGQPLNTHVKLVNIVTDWIQVSQINGFSLLRELILLGNYNALDWAKVTVHYDFDESDFDTYYLDLSARSTSERVRLQLKRYKCSSFKIKIEARTKRPCSFSGFTIEYAVDPQAALGVSGALGGASSGVSG